MLENGLGHVKPGLGLVLGSSVKSAFNSGFNPNVNPVSFRQPVVAIDAAEPFICIPPPDSGMIIFAAWPGNRLFKSPSAKRVRARTTRFLGMKRVI
jgi:hypothetical protein